MNRSTELVGLVLVDVVTVASTVPVPGGDVAVIWPELTTWTLVAPFDPNLTAFAPLRLFPVIVTPVPPAVGPDDGLRPVTTGTVGGTTVAESDTVALPRLFPTEVIVTETVYVPVAAYSGFR